MIFALKTGSKKYTLIPTDSSVIISDNFPTNYGYAHPDGITDDGDRSHQLIKNLIRGDVTVLRFQRAEYGLADLFSDITNPMTSDGETSQG